MCAALLSARCASHPGRPASSSSPLPTIQCPTGLVALLPTESTGWLFARPAAIFTDPQLGPIVRRAMEGEPERGLVQRAARTGYDVRTLERVAGAWSDRGSVWFALGPLDTDRIVALLWDRLVGPRRRGGDRRVAERVEGILGASPVAAVTVPSCGAAAYADGDALRVVDRLVDPPPGHDPDALLAWSTRQPPRELVHATDAALIRQVARLRLVVRRAEQGITLDLTLEGPLQSDAASRVRAAAVAFVNAPLGELSGAVQWLDPEHLQMGISDGRLRVQVPVPFRALSAFADALRESVQP